MLIDKSSRAALPDLLSGILEASLNGIITCEVMRDPPGDATPLAQIVDFQFVRLNQAASRMLGLPANVVGHSLRNGWPAGAAAGLIERFAHVVNTDEAERFEVAVDVGERSVWFDMSVVKFDDGVVATFNDVTASKHDKLRIEQQAAENARQRELLNGILNSSTSGLIALDAVRDAAGQIVDLRFVMVNEAASRITQLPAEQMMGQLMLTVHPGNVESGLFDLYVRTIETGQPAHVQQRYDYDGLDFWLDLSAQPLGDGLVVTFTDVSEAKQAELALARASSENKQQAELMQNMLDGALNGVLLLDAVRDESGSNVVDFRIRAANQAIEPLTGARPQTAIGQLMSVVYPGYKDGGFFALYKDVLATGQAQQREYYYTDDRLKGWFQVSAVKQGDSIVLTFTNTTAIRQAQQALEQARADLQTVLDTSQTGIFVFSPMHDEAGNVVDFRFKAINRMVAALVGQTPDVLTGAVASDWFVSYRETGLFDQYRRTYETGEPVHFDIHYNVDGFDVWFDVQATKWENDVLVTFTDVSETKRLQQAFAQHAAANKQQADLLNSVLNSAISGIMSFEAIRNAAGQIADFRFVTVNDASEQIVGVPIDTMLGNTLLTLFPGNVDSGLFAMYVNVTETGEPARSETYYNHDGLDFWLDISARKLGNGFVVTFTDVSVVKRAAKVVEESAAQLQTVIDTAQTGIFLFDPVRDPDGNVVDFRFRMANRQLASYVGQESAAVVGALGSRWFPDYQTNGLFERYLHTYQSGRQQRFDFHYVGGGIDVWLDIMATKMGDGVLVTFADYTSMKQLQEQLEASVQDLQRSNANLEQFAYVASHDLQEPLRKITAFGDLLRDQHAPNLGAGGADLIGRMQSAATRMQVLIRDLLAYSRLSTKREEFRTVDANRLVQDVLADLETVIADTGATVNVAVHTRLKGDPLQLRQLFQNLISNALKFRKPGVAPQVRITDRPVLGADAGLPVSDADANRPFALIDVTDNGIGFDAKYADRIFQVFQRLHGRTQYEGTGIGLAIVRKVVDNHQGYITVDSQPGAGTTFRVLLPSATPLAAPEPAVG